MFDKKSPVGYKPIKNSIITCAFGVKGDSWRDGWHKGVDFRAKNAPVYAYQNGKCVNVAEDPQWGLFVKLEHKNTGIWSYYCHLKKAFIGIGETVEANHPIAESGNSGTNLKTGKQQPYHLHFETRTIDPKESIEPLFFEEENDGTKTST